jgi:BCD family chlorophyll transporter-like MFS transporter
MKRSALIRLGLFQLSAGGLSVLFLGVLNRILRVELGLDLFVVSVLIGGGHYLGALAAIPFGFLSDRRPLFGYRRSIYILLGAFITALILALSPRLAIWLSSEITPAKLAFGFCFFLLEGIATFLSGTAFLALIADRTKPVERGQATGLIWTMLFLGIIVTGIGTGVVLQNYSFRNFANSFSIFAVLAILFSFVALFRQENKAPVSQKSDASRKFIEAIQLILTNRSSRWFGSFLLLSMFSFFMHDVILEPFGGEVLGLDPGATTRFNAYMGVGLITSMLLGGMALIPRYGKKWVIGLGCMILVAAFIGLTISAQFQSSSAIEMIIMLLGLGGGFFTVGGVALMMDMTASQHTGLFVGAWTLVQALARGPASLVGGGLYDLFVRFGATPGQGYGAIFLLEATGMLFSILLLRRVRVTHFQEDMVAFEALATEAMD